MHSGDSRRLQTFKTTNMARRKYSFLRNYYLGNALHRGFIDPIMKLPPDAPRIPKTKILTFDERDEKDPVRLMVYNSTEKEVGIHRPPRHHYAGLSDKEYEKRFPLTEEQKEMVRRRKEKDERDDKIVGWAIILIILAVIVFITWKYVEYSLNHPTIWG